MWQRLQNSWELVKASAGVLQQDKELIVFPLASTLATIAVMVAFAIPLLAADVFVNVANDGDPGAVGYIIAFLFYLTMYFIVIFANSALVGAAMIRLNGGDPTLRDGFNIAMARVHTIFGYAIIAATVGMILRYLRDKGGLAGAVVSWLGDVAWSLATYLVVPVLVVEDVSPLDAVKRSASLLRDTWGEQIAGNFSIGLVFTLLGIAVVVLIGGPMLAVAIALESILLVALSIGVIVLLVAVVSLTGSTLNGIYVAALYRYATEGQVETQFFRPDLIEGAFRKKKR